MKISELNNPQNYVYIRVLAGLSNRFKVGDYIKTYNFEYYNQDTHEEYDKPKWMPNSCTIANFRSAFDSNKNFRVNATLIQKITMIKDGYIEAKTEAPCDESLSEHMYISDDVESLTGYNLSEEIDSHMEELSEDTEVDDIVSFFIDNYIRLDDDYADSIIMETPYTPYSNATELKEKIKQVADAYEKERKELLRQRALRGHETRRVRKAAAIKQAIREARAAAYAKRKRLAKKKTITKKKRK
jgi:hypothetical protein